MQKLLTKAIDYILLKSMDISNCDSSLKNLQKKHYQNIKISSFKLSMPDQHNTNNVIFTKTYFDVSVHLRENICI